MINTMEIINEGDCNFQKINELVHELTNQEDLLKRHALKRKIFELLFDKQILSNDFIIKNNK